MNWTIDDIITTDRQLAAFPEDYFKADVFQQTHVEWRGRTCRPPKCPRKRIIAGHSDYPISDAVIRNWPADKWQAVNAASAQVQGLPLGITNDCADGEVFPILGNRQQMVEVAQEPRRIQNLVYMNFSTNTQGPRAAVYLKFVDKPWVTQGDMVQTMEGRRKYLQELRNHEFVLCPRGGGVDTHRLWETLYMGSIPIVQRDPVHRGWQDLPICWIDSWDEVTPEFLQKQKQEILNRRVNLDKLKIGYWIRILRQDE